MSSKRFCDRCTEPIMGDNYLYVNSIPVGTCVGYKFTADLCPNCAKTVYTTITGKEPKIEEPRSDKYYHR